MSSQTETLTPRDAAREPGRNTRWIVLKFGGTSVSSLERWNTVRRVVERCIEDGLRPVVVCSALSQVSNQLEALLAAALEARDLAPGLERLRETHRALATAMELDADALLGELFEDLERTLTGIALTREATPRLRARVSSAGELLCTRLGVAWLRRQGLRVAWQDARDLLDADPEPRSALGASRQYLSATCDDGPDPELADRLAALDADAIVTQGFIARGPEGDTVLLGRGGSDTSAAYLAGRLRAERLEIWTDVPGLFTANPAQVPEARLLRRLDYTEAGELASRGAKVLHPRCLRPVRKHRIPLHVRSTPWPAMEGTVIAPRTREGRSGILAVAARRNLILVHMDLEATWQQVGVIAEVAGCFQALGLSIDVFASSQTHVTVALDPAANQLTDPVLEALAVELKQIGSPRINRAGASVSLVGTSIADVLHELGPLLEDLESENVHLVSHAANDRSLTMLVDQDAADRIVQALHAKLFASRSPDPDFGPSWKELCQQAESSAAPPSP